MKNSEQFVRFTRDLVLQSNEVMVSLDVVSLFTNVPTSDAWTIVGE